MRIGVAATTRFHMFDLARQLSRKGEEVRLFTALPGWKVDPDLRALAASRASRLVMWRAAARPPPISRTNAWENRTFGDLGRWVSKKIRRAPLDVLDALDGLGSEAGPVVQRQGGVWIC